MLDALRQACIDRAGRAFVGEQPPCSAMPSQVLAHIKMGNRNGLPRAKSPFVQALPQSSARGNWSETPAMLETRSQGAIAQATSANLPAVRVRPLCHGLATTLFGTERNC